MARELRGYQTRTPKVRYATGGGPSMTCEQCGRTLPAWLEQAHARRCEGTPEHAALVAKIAANLDALLAAREPNPVVDRAAQEARITADMAFPG